MSLKDRMMKRQQTHEKGYVSFTEEDLNEAKTNNAANAEAYSLLDAAMRTSSNITEVDRHGDSVVIDDIYPVTEAECDEMDALLKKAEEAVVDHNDQFFIERHRELKYIVSWSRAKHWTFQWTLILGCVLSIFGMMHLRNKAEKNAAAREGELAMVQAWEKQDTTIAFDACPKDWIEIDRSTANHHKATTLQNVRHDIVNKEGLMAYHQSIVDTCTNAETVSANQRLIKEDKQKIEELTEQYNEINDMDFKAYQKYVVKDMKGDTRAAKKHAVWMWIFLVYVIILIPLYIYSSHQYGYNITRHREEANTLDGIQKVGFSIATFFLGAGLAMALLPDMEVTTQYSDGSSDTHTEGNTLNILIYALKAIMILIGLIIFAVVSVVIMTYVTVMAAKRDHDWSKVSAAAQTIAKKATDKVQEKINK